MSSNTPPSNDPIESLAQYHPLIIEGMGGYDPRDPEPIARQIVSKLRDRWQAQPLAKPVILVTQGDPLGERGISIGALLDFYATRPVPHLIDRPDAPP